MQTISHEELSNKLAINSDMLLVNVLPEDKVDLTVPGSINIPYNAENFTKEVEEAANGKDKEVVVFCANEQCTASDDAAEKLESVGFSNVSDFKGGIKEWEEGGHDLKSGKEGESCGTGCGCA